MAYIGGAIGFGASCALLQSLSLADCKRISDTSLQVLAKGCLRLRFLNLSGCEKVIQVAPQLSPPSVYSDVLVATLLARCEASSVCGVVIVSKTYDIVSTGHLFSPLLATSTTLPYGRSPPKVSNTLLGDVTRWQSSTYTIVARFRYEWLGAPSGWGARSPPRLMFIFASTNTAFPRVFFGGGCLVELASRLFDDI